MALPNHPTKLELEILGVLWRTGPACVRDIQAVLSESKPTGYTTVLKMVQIMTQKGLLTRDDSVRPQLYRPKASQARTQRQLLSDLISRAYGGSVKTLILQALGTAKPSAATLQAIEKLLDETEGAKK
jgi:BlaI family transcriptional regulator, penicillinase repressor